jgi:hypothetical protein
VKEKVHAKGTEEEVGGDQPPELSPVEDQIVIEVKRQRADNVHGAGGGRQKGAGQVKARHRWNLPVPVITAAAAAAAAAPANNNMNNSNISKQYLTTKNNNSANSPPSVARGAIDA